MKELIDAGKIKHYGLSNETTFGVCQWVKEADAIGCPRYRSKSQWRGLYLGRPRCRSSRRTLKPKQPYAPEDCQGPGVLGKLWDVAGFV